MYVQHLRLRLFLPAAFASSSDASKKLAAADVSMFRTVTSDMRYFLIMMGIFIVSNGFALTLLFPTHLHPHGDAAPDSEATMYNMSNPFAVSETVGTVSCHSYRCHLGCILPTMPAISSLTGLPSHVRELQHDDGGVRRHTA